MVRNVARKLCFLLGLAVMTVVCFVFWDSLNAPMTVRAAELMETPEPEIVYVEKTVTETVTEHVNIPQLVTVEVPVVVEKQIVVDRPIIAQDSAERWQGIDITPEDIELLACLAWREARGEKILGMRLVVEVVLNRVLNEHFPDNIYDVLYQPGQFTPDYGVPELDEITPTEAQYEAVRLAITETPILEPDVVFFARSPIYGEIFLHVGAHYFTRYPDSW